MEEALSLLKKKGWNISLEKLKAQFQNEENEAEAEKQFLRNPERWVIDEDLRNIGIPCLQQGTSSGKTPQLSIPIVLQITKLENVSAPKRNQESDTAPRMLKLTLTDGKGCCHGIEFDHIQRLSLKTPPGTKICLTGAVKSVDGFLCLDAKNLLYLGGEVSELIEEWKVQQLLLGHVRTQEQDGPPQWVPFGKKIEPLKNVDGKDKKTLEEKEKGVQDEEFLNQRQGAIAAASDKSGVTKVIQGSGRQLEMQQSDRRGRGRGRERRERTSRRDEELASRPRDSIRLFEFLQPQIGEAKKEENSDFSEGDDVGPDQEDGPSWERDGVYRPPGRGRSMGDHHNFRGHVTYHDRGESHHRGRRGSRGRGGSYQDDSYRDRRDSHRGRDSRESRQDHDWRGIKTGGDDRGRSHQDGDASYTGRGRSYQDRRGSSRGGRRGGGGGRGYHRDIEDSYSNQRSYRDYPSNQSPIDTLVDDFNAWPGLESKPSSSQSSAQVAQVQTHVRSVAPKVQDQWAVEDFCLAKWESSDQHYPAVIQQLHPARKAATVFFVESGAIRIVETKHLLRDPQDDGDRSGFASRSRGNRASRIYTPRNRGGVGGGGGGGGGRGW